MLIYGMTDIGMVRKENQDSYGIQTDLPSGHMVGAVCDGMGGPAGGQLASSIALETYMTALETRLHSGMGLEDVKRASEDAVREANRAVWDAAQKKGYLSMGTTLVSAVASGADVVISNVGDSRAYAISRHEVTCLTRDHSLVQEMVERGELTPQEARIHPNRNLITRALGPDENVLCDTYFYHMPPDTFLLLCSDGLVNTVTDAEMLELVWTYAPDGCPAALIDAAKKRGAPDNVTVVLMRNAQEGGGQA